MAKTKRLYEFSALLDYHFVIAADCEVDAKEEIKTYEKTWLKGDFIGVSDVQLVNISDTVSANTVIDEAHVII